MTPTRIGYTFSPVILSVTINEANATAVNFTAQASSQPGVVGIDANTSADGPTAAKTISASVSTNAGNELLLAFVATAGIEPEVGLELPLEKAADGFRAMLDGDTSGKIVFTR